LVLVGVVLALVVSTGAVYQCGNYGPLQWVNNGPTQVFTSHFGSPLGFAFGAPFLFGCSPDKAVVTTKNMTADLTFTYSPLEKTLFLVSKMTSSSLTFTADYARSTGPEVVIQAFNIPDLKSEHLHGDFSYKPISPHYLLNYTEVETTLDRSVLLDLLLHRRMFFPAHREEPNPSDKVVTISALFSYGMHSLPKLPSEILIYQSGVKIGQIYYNYTTTAKGYLVGSEIAKLETPRGNSTQTYTYIYSKENNLLNEVRITAGATRQVQFYYDNNNRLIRANYDNSKEFTYLTYQSNGEISTFNSTLHELNVEFS